MCNEMLLTCPYFSYNGHKGLPTVGQYYVDVKSFENMALPMLDVMVSPGYVFHKEEYTLTT